MKKIILLISIPLTCLLFISISCNPKHLSAGTEDVINVLPDTVPVKTGNIYIGNATKDISICTPRGTCTSLESTTFILTQSEMDTLREKANNLGSGATGGHITAIELLYGINSSYNFDLYLKPLYLIRSDSTDSTYTYTATPASLNVSTNPFYLLSCSGTNNEITQVNPNQSSRDSLNYQTCIRIIHDSTDTIRKFIPGSDVTSVVYPFQEIDTVMNANKTTSLTLYSIGIPKGVPSIVRHDIMLAPLLNLLKGFPTKEYADLTNMCPPDCPNSGVIYTIIKSSK